ncbi:MAG: class II aldolase/adducin family protein [archaeon]|nr:class II aldolase/adducin family protein [archaeon]
MTSEEFIKYCRIIGKNQDLVQGGGGNISVKINPGKMIVKTSGIELEKVSKKMGHVAVDYGKIASFIKKMSRQKNTRNEKKYMATLQESVLKKHGKQPSMEAGFHAVLGKAVIHTHPVAINSIGCAKNAEKMFQQALKGKKFAWISYKSPGLELSVSVLEEKQKAGGKNPLVILLENHGIIVSSGSLKECYEETIKLEKKAKKFLEKKGVKVHLASNMEPEKTWKNQLVVKELKKVWGQKTFKNFSKHFLFPDAAVYIETPISLENSAKSKVKIRENGVVEIAEHDSAKKRKIFQVLLASLCIILNIMQFSKPKYIPEKKVLELHNMELEKIRKKAK